MDSGMWVTELGMWVTGYELSTRCVAEVANRSLKADCTDFTPVLADFSIFQDNAFSSILNIPANYQTN